MMIFKRSRIKWDVMTVVTKYIDALCNARTPLGCCGFIHVTKLSKQHQILTEIIGRDDVWDGVSEIIDDFCIFTNNFATFSL